LEIIPEKIALEKKFQIFLTTNLLSSGAKGNEYLDFEFLINNP
jgi:hypothetical protein